MTGRVGCKVCGADTRSAGCKIGRWMRQPFRLRQCPACGYGFVANPRTDYARIYSEEYYTGAGADPMVDYLFELEHPAQTTRIYEWWGIAEAVASLRPVVPATRWLDFGCGNGGLVRHLRAAHGCQAFGFEEGWIAEKARCYGIPVLARGEMEGLIASFDVVTAIEVLEHVEEPVEVLRSLYRLLKPGGLLFLTTGNARPHRRRLARWPYVIPEVHISFFEPKTLDRALIEAGFKPRFYGFLPGYRNIIRFKILKNIGARRRQKWHDYLPWTALSRVADCIYQITGHPLAWRPDAPGGAADSTGRSTSAP